MCIRDREMGQFTDAGSIETNWNRFCIKDVNLLGSWAFTANDIPLAIDLLDKNNKTLATSKPITTNQFRGTVEWATGDPGNLTGQTVSLRFRFRRTQLYSYWYQPPAG